MKVLYLINHAGGGGSEQYVLSLIDKLSKEGIECCFAYNEFGLLAESFSVEEIGAFENMIKKRRDLSNNSEQAFLETASELNREARRIKGKAEGEDLSQLIARRRQENKE